MREPLAADDTLLDGGAGLQRRAQHPGPFGEECAGLVAVSAVLQGTD
jgi:hypothetical protein